MCSSTNPAGRPKGAGKLFDFAVGMFILVKTSLKDYTRLARRDGLTVLPPPSKSTSRLYRPVGLFLWGLQWTHVKTNKGGSSKMNTTP
jgi:hypothetical protein